MIPAHIQFHVTDILIKPLTNIFFYWFSFFLIVWSTKPQKIVKIPFRLLYNSSTCTQVTCLTNNPQFSDNQLAVICDKERKQQILTVGKLELVNSILFEKLSTFVIIIMINQCNKWEINSKCLYWHQLRFKWQLYSFAFIIAYSCIILTRKIVGKTLIRIVPEIRHKNDNALLLFSLLLCNMEMLHWNVTIRSKFESSVGVQEAFLCNQTYYMTFIEMSSANRMRLHASQRQTLARMCSVSGDFNPGSFINLASGDHIISRLFLEAQLQFVSLKGGCWIVRNTKDMLSFVWGRRHTVTKEIQGTKLCAVTQSCLSLNNCLFCLPGPPAHWHMNYTAEMLLCVLPNTD